MKFRKCLPIRGHTREKQKNDQGLERIIRSLVFCVLAVGLVIAFDDAKWMEQGGREISDISSISGRTIEEAYYHKLECVYRGYALIVLAVERVAAVMLVWAEIKK